MHRISPIFVQVDLLFRLASSFGRVVSFENVLSASCEVVRKKENICAHKGRGDGTIEAWIRFSRK